MGHQKYLGTSVINQQVTKAIPTAKIYQQQKALEACLHPGPCSHIGWLWRYQHARKLAYHVEVVHSSNCVMTFV
ncbi:MAG: hypothetical protein ACLR9W_05055 [Enterobacter hormaechei]